MSYRWEGPDRPGRVVAGVDVTLSGLQALRVAVAEARRRQIALHAVRAWGSGPGEPPMPLPATTNLGLTGPMVTGATGRPTIAGPTRSTLANNAAEVVARAFAETMGGEPPDLPVRAMALPDSPGPALVEYACHDDDLLVIGSGKRSRLRRPRGSPVVRYCLRHAACPVLVVPPPPLTRAGSPRSLLRELRREIDHLTDGGADRTA